MSNAIYAKQRETFYGISQPCKPYIPSFIRRKLRKSLFNIIFVELRNKLNRLRSFLGWIFLCFQNVLVTNVSQKSAQTKYLLTNTDRFAGPLWCTFFSLIRLNSVTYSTLSWFAYGIEGIWMSVLSPLQFFSHLYWQKLFAVDTLTILIHNYFLQEKRFLWIVKYQFKTLRQ